MAHNFRALAGPPLGQQVERGDFIGVGSRCPAAMRRPDTPWTRRKPASMAWAACQRLAAISVGKQDNTSRSAVFRPSSRSSSVSIPPTSRAWR
ncbi:MAG: hypothetical protein IPK83_24985, partial [Planctomycetes bacterium]|nr:hypothetical protein [Planctomycetota bacterium]